MSSGYRASGYGFPGNEMRVGNAEREATAAELREHYASGRLTLDELNERLEAIFAAKTRGDLTAAMRDLPSAGASGTPTPGTGTGAPSPGQAWAGPRGGGAGQWGGWAGGRCGGAGQRAGSVFSTMIAVGLLAFFGLIAVAGFGIGGGRPFGIALLIAAVALLRRLFFGRRRVRAGRSRGRRW